MTRRQVERLSCLDTC